MTALIERIIIFILSILLLKVEQVDYVMVCLILVVIISICIIFYFDDKKILNIISIIYIGLCMCFTTFLSFIPCIIYECSRRKSNLLCGIHSVVGIAAYFFINQGLDFSLAKYMFFIFVAFFIGVRSARDEKNNEIIHDLQDKESYLYQINKKRQDELRKNQDYEIQTATLTERNRIAREIHDNVGHTISRSILQLGAIMTINKDETLKELLNGLKNSLDTAMNNIRESVHDIKDESIDLEYIINDIIKDYKDLNIDFDYDMNVYTSKELKYCFISIIKEALTNTVKHSDATKVNIVIREHPALYQLLVEDNGSGNKGDKSDNTGIGLDNMKERVYAFKGNILITNNNGYRIFVSIPKEK
jgi:signal transduction histidine kinase